MSESMKCSKCGKKFKSKSGKSNHEKKCEVVISAKVPSFKKNIDIGSRIVLDGDVLAQNMAYEWEVSSNSGEVVTVIGKEKDDNGTIWLVCKGSDSNVWAVDESSSNYSVDDELSGDVSYEKKQIVFRQAVISFDSTNEKKKLATKEHEKNDKVQRPVIVEFLQEYGKESADGKQDQYIADFGYVVHNVRTPGKPIIKYDSNKIVEWLEANGHENCVEKKVNVSMWDGLKASGKVPAEFIREVEIPDYTKDSFALVIKKGD